MVGRSVGEKICPHDESKRGKRGWRRHCKIKAHRLMRRWAKVYLDDAPTKYRYAGWSN